MGDVAAVAQSGVAARRSSEVGGNAVVGVDVDGVGGGGCGPGDERELGRSPPLVSDYK